MKTSLISVEMNLLNVVNWIGVFALAVGALISAVNGGFVSALFAVLFTSLLITSLMPFTGKVGLMLRGIPRIEMMQRGARLIGLVGCWLLAGIGGLEYVPAAIILTISLLVSVAMIIKAKRGNRAMITDANFNNGTTLNSLNTLSTSDKPLGGVKLTTPQSPPQYTAVEEKPREDGSHVTVVKIETPVFNV